MRRIPQTWPALLAAAVWLFPCAALAVAAADGGGRGMWWWVGQRAWRVAAEHTLIQCSMVAGIAFILGWLPGVFAGFAPRAWRTAIQGVCALPLLMPPFLWAIGWAFLQRRAPLAWHEWFVGQWGLLCSGLALAVPLVMLAASVAVSTIPGPQWDFAVTRLAPWAVRRRAAARAWPAAASAALLAAMLGAGDAGAGQIMGRHGMAGEVLVALAARQDTGEAAAKAFASTLLLLPGALASAWLTTKAWSPRLSARGSSRLGEIPVQLRLGWRFALGLLVVALLPIAFPAIGLATPLQRPRAEFYLAESFSLWRESAGPTLWYSLGSGGVAAVSGMLLAAAWAGRAWFTAACLLALALPSSLRSLGWVTAGSQLPLVRAVLAGEPGVAIVLGLQWIPLAALLLSPACAALPASWSDRRLLTGVPRRQYAVFVLMPALAPWLLLAVLVCGLLTLADVTSLMLLQPPGATAFTSHVFAVMDNSSEALVSSLCIALLAGPLALGLAIQFCIVLVRRLRPC